MIKNSLTLSLYINTLSTYKVIIYLVCSVCVGGRVVHMCAHVPQCTSRELVGVSSPFKPMDPRNDCWSGVMIDALTH